MNLRCDRTSRRFGIYAFRLQIFSTYNILVTMVLISISYTATQHAAASNSISIKDRIEAQAIEKLKHLGHASKYVDYMRNKIRRDVGSKISRVLCWASYRALTKKIADVSNLTPDVKTKHVEWSGPCGTRFTALTGYPRFRNLPIELHRYNEKLFCLKLERERISRICNCLGNNNSPGSASQTIAAEDRFSSIRIHLKNLKKHNRSAYKSKAVRMLVKDSEKALECANNQTLNQLKHIEKRVLELSDP